MRIISALSLFAAVASASAFVSSPGPVFGVRSGVCLSAKHVINKGARKSAANRPKKKRLSDINRKPTNYPPIVKPAEYTIVSVGEASN